MTPSTTRFAASLCALALAALQPACKAESSDAGEASAPREARAAAKPVKRGAIGVPARPTPPPALPADPGGTSGKPTWAVRLGGIAAESGRAVAVDARGNVYLAGLFRGTVDFGGGARFTAGRADGFLARFGADGALRWARQLGGVNDDIADALAIDPQGNAVVAGSFSDKLSVGDGTLESEGADDLFVAVFDPEGRRRWARRMGGVDVDAADGVAVDRRGAIAVVGVYAGYIALGGEHELVGSGQSDILLVVMEPDGTVRWAKGWASPGADEGRAVGFDEKGNLYVLVEFSRAVDFGGGPLESVGNRDLGLIKLDPTGRHLWSRSFGSNLDELGVSLAVDPAGSVIITGSFDDALDFGDGPMRTAGRSDVFIAKFAPDGNLMWSRRLGNKDEDIGAAVATDAYGNVYAAGWYWRQLDLLGKPFASAGKKDAFLYALSPAGDGLWVRTFGGPEDDYGRGLAADDKGVYLTGTFHRTVEMGEAKLTAAAAPGARLPLGDAFLTKLER
ncbi:MAG TPA: hypothetical protein VNO33_03540 [Kofleriaceae bacterium]|nr:hypothetical protein [Kofleriaceae bacterium]